MVVRTKWDHVGNVLALGNALLRKTWAVSVLLHCYLERKTRNKVGDFRFQPR